MIRVRVLVPGALAVAVLALSGCAVQVVSSSERTVMIDAGSARGADVQTLANAECKKYGRAARLSIKPQNYTERSWVFDCER